MAEETENPKSWDSQSHCTMDCSGATPPGRQIRLPPSPPAIDERRGIKPDASTADPVLSSILDTLHKAETQPLTEFFETKIARRHYDQLFETLERDFRQFDYDTGTELLTLRMPSKVHDFFLRFFTRDLVDQLTKIADGGGEAGGFASRIIDGGSATIHLAEGDSGDWVDHQPDGQFLHELAQYPGVVVEVAYSQDGKFLKKSAQDYILHSNGGIKVVIGIDINYRGKESTVSLWRPKCTRQDDEELPLLQSTQDIAYQPFRASDGSAINQEKCLRLKLSDFAPDEIASGHESILLPVPFERLFHFLTRAEVMARRQDIMQGIKPRQQTRKRKHSSSPVDELRPKDKKRYEQENQAMERGDAADEDFEPPAAKRR